jgi:hypothetical protein
MLRAVTLEADFYEEVEAEHASIRQAAVIVLMACAAGAAGSYFAAKPTLQVAVGLIEPLVLWLGGSAFAYMVGATFFRGPETETDYAEVLRTTGFAFTPALLRLFAFVPPPHLVGFAITVVADLWVLIAAIVAVRQALDFTTARAIGTFGVAYLLLWMLLWAFFTLLPI